MTKDVLKQEIIDIFKKKTSWKLQTIRDNISRFKTKECPHATQNAAAHVLALAKGFSCKKRLKKEDIATIPQNIADIIDKYKTKKNNERKIELPIKKFKRKINLCTNPLERDAWRNAIIYPSVYILENKLRMLILKQMGADQSWWITPKVPQRIIDYANKIKEDEKSTPWIEERGDHPIYYVTLKHLTKIIQINWPKFNKLGNQNSFLTRLEDLFPMRHGLAHHIPLTPRDKKEVDLTKDKICKLINSKYKI